MKALVVGGTGPTGPFIVNGLLERGYEVAIFHRGTHEVAEIPHADGRVRAILFLADLSLPSPQRWQDSAGVHR